jgi:hypothetical protein
VVKPEAGLFVVLEQSQPCLSVRTLRRATSTWATAARAGSSLSGHMCPHVSMVVFADECLRLF